MLAQISVRAPTVEVREDVPTPVCTNIEHVLPGLISLQDGLPLSRCGRHYQLQLFGVSSL